MGIKRALKKEGISIVSELDTLTVNSLSKKIADKISSRFPELKLNSNELFMNLSRLNMYYAKLPRGISAKYFYKNKSIYFNYELEIQQLVDVAIHECIHYLQEKTDRNGNILRLGLCDYTTGDLAAVGLNEAAVQLMASKCMDSEYESVKYFDINLLTNTPTYYPLECTLVNQLAYVIGENVLFDSTINANNKFKEQFISLTSAKTFFTIQKNIDELVETQEKLYADVQETDIDEYYEKKYMSEIEDNKKKVQKLFLDTQKIILTSYFDSAINIAYTPKLIENYRNKLYGFQNYIGRIDGDNFYNEYYIDKMVELEKKYDEDITEIRDLVVVKHNFISKLLQKIKLLLGFNPEYERLINGGK